MSFSVRSAHWLPARVRTLSHRAKRNFFDPIQSDGMDLRATTSLFFLGFHRPMTLQKSLRAVEEQFHCTRVLTAAIEDQMSPVHLVVTIEIVRPLAVLVPLEAVEDVRPRYVREKLEVEKSYVTSTG